MIDRDLEWDGCLNVRDLGGLPAHGGRTRRGAVVRADSRASLTDAGWLSLLGYGVSRIVDLRRPAERADDPAPPDGVDVEVVHVSLMDGIEPGDPAWAEVVAAAEAAPTLRDGYEIFYAAALERCRPAVAAALAAIADAPPGAVVVHCAGGKDRTGLVVAQLLRLCGVSLETIDADYTATEARLLARFDPETAAAPAGAMEATLAGLERRHGSVEAYLAGSGLGETAIARLRGRLLAPREVASA